MTQEERILRLENQVQALVRESISLLALVEMVINSIPEAHPSDRQCKLKLLVALEQRRQALKTIKPLRSSIYS